MKLNTTQFSLHPEPSKEEKPARKEALTGVDGHIKEALVKSAAPLEDLAALRGVHTATSFMSLKGQVMPERVGEDGEVQPGSMVVNMEESGKDRVRIATHELGHVLQYRGVQYGYGAETGMPRPTDDFTQTHRMYERTLDPWAEGGAAGYEARFTPQKYASPSEYDSYNWKKGEGVHSGPYADSVYRLAKATAMRTGDPGSRLKINQTLGGLVDRTDPVEGGAYQGAVSRMLLNETVRGINPPEMNMMAVPFDQERKAREG